MVLESRAFSLEDLGRSVQRLFAGATRDKPDLEVSLIFDENLPDHVLGDPLRLRQILSNLVGNAVKFTERGSVELRILSLMQDVVGISVRDTGIGIPPDQHERIFEPFEQADDSSTRQFGGTGLA